jgi:hypothetical protein
MDELFEPRDDSVERFLVRWHGAPSEASDRGGWSLQMVGFEAIWAAHHAIGVGIPATGLPNALEPLSDLPVRAWRWPIYPTRFYAGVDVLACVNPTEPGDEAGFDVLIGAKDPARVREVESLST